MFIVCEFQYSNRKCSPTSSRLASRRLPTSAYLNNFIYNCSPDNSPSHSQSLNVSTRALCRATTWGNPEIRDQFSRLPRAFTEPVLSRVLPQSRRSDWLNHRLISNHSPLSEHSLASRRLRAGYWVSRYSSDGLIRRSRTFSRIYGRRCLYASIVFIAGSQLNKSSNVVAFIAKSSSV